MQQTYCILYIAHSHPSLGRTPSCTATFSTLYSKSVIKNKGVFNEVYYFFKKRKEFHCRTWWKKKNTFLINRKSKLTRWRLQMFSRESNIHKKTYSITLFRYLIFMHLLASIIQMLSNDVTCYKTVTVYSASYVLTNFMTYETQRFNAAFTTTRVTTLPITQSSKIPRKKQ